VCIIWQAGSHLQTSYSAARGATTSLCILCRWMAPWTPSAPMANDPEGCKIEARNIYILSDCTGDSLWDPAVQYAACYCTCDSPSGLECGRHVSVCLTARVAPSGFAWAPCLVTDSY
jgi:hypothetical protein